jgi:hypothetical protein
LVNETVGFVVEPGCDLCVSLTLLFTFHPQLNVRSLICFELESVQLLLLLVLGRLVKSDWLCWLNVGDVGSDGVGSTSNVEQIEWLIVGVDRGWQFLL